MSAPQTLHLHAGAHKTATTHLQHRLQAVQKDLQTQGIHFHGPKFWRSPVKTNPWSRSQKPLNLWISEQRRLQKLIPESPLWLISEENIAGLPVDLLETESLYPNLERRIGFLKSAMPETAFRLFFSIRSYADYFRSMYCEIMRNRHAPPFQAFYDEDRFNNLSWHRLVQRLQGVLEPHEMVLWRYEDFAALETRLLQALTGNRLPDDFDFPLVRKRTRPSLSADAMEALSALPAPATRSEHQQRIATITRRYPANKHERFDPWTPEEVQKLNDRYRHDLAAIQTEFPSIVFLNPSDSA